MRGPREVCAALCALRRAEFCYAGLGRRSRSRAPLCFVVRLGGFRWQSDFEAGVRILDFLIMGHTVRKEDSR